MEKLTTSTTTAFTTKDIYPAQIAQQEKNYQNKECYNCAKPTCKPTSKLPIESV